MRFGRSSGSSGVGCAIGRGWTVALLVPPLLAALPAAGQPAPCGPPLASIVVGPFLQDAEPDEITVVWETDAADGAASVEVGTDASLGSAVAGASEVGSGASRIHRATLDGLSADTRYFYRARTTTTCSEVHAFRTPPLAASETPFRFVAYSDSQRDAANPDQHGATVEDGILPFVAGEFGPDLADELAFVLVPGDLVANGTIYSQWEDQFFDEAQSLSQSVPYYPVPGNHERNAASFFQYFTLPENGTPGSLEHWYTKDYGNVRVIGLDSNTTYIDDQAQLDWLDAVLADTCALGHIDFVIAQLHHPFQSELWTPGERPYTGEVVERLEQFSAGCGKPSAHLFGHTHAYSRGQSRDHQHFWIGVATAEGNIDYWNELPNFDYPEFQRSFPEWGFVLFESEAGADPSLRVRRVSLGNDVQPLANVVRDDFTIRPSDAPPVAPTAAGPVSTGSGVDPARVRLFGSAFSDPGADGLLESHFQLTDAPGDYAAPLFEDWRRFENWYGPPTATGTPADGGFSIDTVDGRTIRRAALAPLAGSASYCWRVRYRDDAFAWSGWSAERCFDTRLAAASDPFGPNRLANPGAESADLSDWTIVDPPLESLAGGECDSVAPFSGARLYAVGGVCAGEGVYGEAYQEVDVSAAAAAIDAGVAELRYGGAMRSFGGNDVPELWLSFRDAGDVEISQTPKLSNATAAWVESLEVVAPPAGTRRIRFHVSGTRTAGTDNDSYLDDLVLQLRTSFASCDNGLDDDGDGFVDFPDDPGCREALSDVEAPACQNGVDDDGDGAIDAVGAPPDPDCAGVPWRATEGPGAQIVFAWQPLEPGPTGELTLDVPGGADGDPFDAGDGPAVLDFSFDDGSEAYTLGAPAALDAISQGGDGLDGGGVDLAVDATSGPGSIGLDFTDVAEVDFVRTPQGDFFGEWVRVGPEPGATATLLSALPLLEALRRRRRRVAGVATEYRGGRRAAMRARVRFGFRSPFRTGSRS